jgi:hypothetical protein
MPKKGRVVKSMRGTVVDFDLIDIQTQLASAPKPATVTAREDFVDRKARRRKRMAERAKAAAALPGVNVEPEAPVNSEVKEELAHVAEEKPVVEKKVVAPVVKKKTTKKTTKKRQIKKKVADE